MAALRSRGVRVIIYLDDMLFLDEEREGLVADVNIGSTSKVGLSHQLGEISPYPLSVTGVLV